MPGNDDSSGATPASGDTPGSYTTVGYTTDPPAGSYTTDMPAGSYTTDLPAGSYTDIEQQHPGFEVVDSTSSSLSGIISTSTPDAELLRSDLRTGLASLEGPTRTVGPQTVQVRPVCGRSGGGPQRLIARRPRFVTYELTPGYQGENVIAMWHTNISADRRRGNKRYTWASLREQADVTVAVRYLRGPESLGEVPPAERDLYDRERYKIEFRPGHPVPEDREMETPPGRTLLFYRGKPMDTLGGEGKHFIFVLSEEGDFYAANVVEENIENGPGAYLRELDQAAEKLLAQGWNHRRLTRQPPVRKGQALTRPVVCALQALDHGKMPDGAVCEGQIQSADEGTFVLGVKAVPGAPTGFAPVDPSGGVEYFVDEVEGGAWVCNPCFARRGRKDCPLRWPVIEAPGFEMSEVTSWIKEKERAHEYPGALDAIDEWNNSRKHVAAALRSAAAHRVAEDAAKRGESPRKLTLLHHSSFLAGRPVACAGTLKVSDGKLEVITNNSGHFSPPRPLVLQALARLNELGVELLNIDMSFLRGRYYDTRSLSGWSDGIRQIFGDVTSPEDMKRTYMGPGDDPLGPLRRALMSGGAGPLLRRGKVVARRPDAALGPCATSGCVGDGEYLLRDSVGEQLLCKPCLDERLAACSVQGCSAPVVHLYGVAEQDAKRGEAAPLRPLCARHFRDESVIRCAEPGCARTSEQGVMDYISRSCFCKEHFTAGMESMGLNVCEDAECTETEEVQQAGGRWLCRAHGA